MHSIRYPMRSARRLCCTTCGACLTRCPAFITPPEQVVDLRRYQVLMMGNMPKSVGDTLRNMERQGNPWGMPPENRLKWAEGLDMRELAPGDEVDVLAGVLRRMQDDLKEHIARLAEETSAEFFDFAAVMPAMPPPITRTELLMWVAPSAAHIRSRRQRR